VGGREPVIAIDGPVGAGKSTVARRLAERLGYELIPTGSMYRAIALSVTRAGLTLDDVEGLCRHLAPVTVTVDRGRIFLGNEDVTDMLHSPALGQATSTLSTLALVRDKVTPWQRREAATGGVVLEGRDTGTVVCPDAEVKFFLTASLESRARRRRAELAAQGVAVTLEDVIDEVRARDQQDSTRALAPLRRAPDAIEVDTTDLAVEDVVARMAQMVEERRCSTRR
jgi:cytidylate kinase